MCGGRPTKDGFERGNKDAQIFNIPKGLIHSEINIPKGKYNNIIV